jgi:hypothetical protein
MVHWRLYYNPRTLEAHVDHFIDGKWHEAERCFDPFQQKLEVLLFGRRMAEWEKDPHNQLFLWAHKEAKRRGSWDS